MADKRQLRREALERREWLAEAFTRESAVALWAHLISVLPVVGGLTIGGYHATREELSLTMVLHELEMRGFSLALPVIDRVVHEMRFVPWSDGEALKKGAYGLMEPRDQEVTAYPEILLLPLLAFDAAGYRLGYGGGYYDRYLAARKAEGRSPLCIGIGYAGQAMLQLPHEAHDMPMDWVVTEEYARKCRC